MLTQKRIASSHQISCENFFAHSNRNLTNRSSRRRFVARFWALRYASPKPHHSRRGLTQVLDLWGERVATNDFIYWTFTAAAQSVAAFIAILLTGYTLGSDLLRSWRANDESLEDIETALKRKVHLQLTVLSIITGSSIIFSLVVVYFNGNYAIPIWA